MSEAAGPEKTLTLSEQWSLQEESNENVTSVGTKENASTEEITDGANSKATAIDVSSTEEKVDLNIHDASLEESNTDKTDETSPVEGTTETIVQEMTEEEETSEAKPVIKLETAPADFRFPTTNQTRHCFTRYIEYHRCINAKGEGDPGCEKFAKYYRSLCPSEWIERWNEQRENGTFPGPL